MFSWYCVSLMCRGGDILNTFGNRFDCIGISNIPTQSKEAICGVNFPYSKYIDNVASYHQLPSVVAIPDVCVHFAFWKFPFFPTVLFPCCSTVSHVCGAAERIF